MGTRTPTGALGPLERALTNTPIIETGYRNAESFSAIDVQRTIQSFDPCMTCSAHIVVDGQRLIRPIETGFAG
ncbi:MAG: hypothetical protein HC872_08020 [Gammaproteobacteria bacterium]|nr:hypothetical protein [Gammaproteobacteria bacterium]